MRCLICDFRTQIHLDPYSPKRYHHCPSCEAIFLDPEFHPSQATAQKQYDQHQNSLDNAGYVAMFEGFLAPLWERLPCKQPYLLDFGSGPTPVLSMLMRQKGAIVEGFDPIYAPTLPTPLRPYDAITSTEVFEHLNDPLSALRWLETLLQRGGILAIMTLFHTNQIALFWEWWYRRDPTHITFYTKRTLEVLGERVGLTPLYDDGKRIFYWQKR